MYKSIHNFIAKLTVGEITPERMLVLRELTQYIQDVKDAGRPININFICTHNSRRSQFAQVWAKVLSEYYQIEINSFSAGVEVTACNERTIQSLETTGFHIVNSEGDNPKYHLKWAEDKDGLQLFSKLLDDEMNPNENFAAVMTCSHADENCPFVVGCNVRIPIRYEDPKIFDDTNEEKLMYDLRSKEIAIEMKYVFSQIK